MKIPRFIFENPKVIDYLSERDLLDQYRLKVKIDFGGIVNILNGI